MRERPILFNGVMVRAILAGQKIQTRRAVRPAPQSIVNGATAPWDGPASALQAMLLAQKRGCAFGQPGDRLWVRETWMDLTGAGIYYWNAATINRMRFIYGAESAVGSASGEAREDLGLKWRPAIHMPRDACRLALKIAAVRVERLQAITEGDPRAQGVVPDQVRMINLAAARLAA